MYDIPFDRSFLQLSNSIKHVMPSTDRKLELTAKASMAQPISQPAVCSNGLTVCGMHYIQQQAVIGSHCLETTSRLKNQNTTNLQLLTQFEVKLENLDFHISYL